ncbi:2-hydroxyacyl-CoA dehydratase family protein [Kineothrix alysoides]|uniref:2-hydroxyacyl-CoA dehydratase family protein n=1 Tax=Kineothrix alysoides TaxID=1469948 RepID=UPI0004DB7B1D|nr:2-hydroxyacyl-CoA dehydratase family protein [Kineothrix alysoides]
MIRPDIHMAYMCGNAIPFEVFLSFGIKLTRIKGDGLVSYNSRCYFPTYMCSYAMSCLDIIIREEQKYDGFIFENKCHAMVALYEYLHEYMPNKKIFMINIPKINSLYSLEYYNIEELKLINFIRNEFNVIISDNILQEKRLEIKRITKYKKEIVDDIAKNSVPLSLRDIEVLDEFPGELHEIYDKELNSLEEKRKERLKTNVILLNYC